MDEQLYLYNTLHRRKEAFTPINPPEVGFYSCGPTVYDRQHLGNMRAVLFADLLKRVLLMNGYNVTHVRNITDVGHLVSDGDEGEDKMEKGAKREGKTAFEIAEYYTKIFHDDVASLQTLPPTIEPKATDHIPEQIDLIKQLEEKGFTYTISDGVYFDTSELSDYGKLALLDLEGLQEGARIEKNSEKKNSTDFALWKFSPKDSQREMEWESPWGKGFPGWHLECSAMAMKYLGQTFDIHTGGIDHVPVHHTNEIAQSESATGKPFANYWLHNEFLALDGDAKMSKSAGTFLTLDSLTEKGYSPLDFKFATLQAHYRSHMKFSWAILDSAKEGRERLNQFVRTIYSLRDGKVVDQDKKYLSDKEDAFKEAVNDDLNAPTALAIVFDLVKDINSQLANNTLAVSPGAIWKWLLKSDEVLGLDLEAMAKTTEDLPPEIEELLARRQIARDQRDFEASDRLRDQIDQLGWTVEDTNSGQKVHKK